MLQPNLEEKRSIPIPLPSTWSPLAADDMHVPGPGID